MGWGGGGGGGGGLWESSGVVASNSRQQDGGKSLLRIKGASLPHSSTTGTEETRLGHPAERPSREARAPRH